MGDDRATLVRSWVEQGFNTGDLTSLAESFHPDVSIYAQTFGGGGDDRASGVQRIAPLLLGFRTAFPPGVFEVDAVDVGDSHATCRWTARGRHERRAFGFRPTLRPIALEGSCRFQFVDGLVKAMWLDFSLYSLFDQLGRLCAGPGEGRPRSVEVNRLAMDLWRKAVVEGDTTGFEAVCEKETAACWLINSGAAGPSPEVYVRSSARDGVDLIPMLVGWLRANLSGIEIDVDEVVSQGSTTTFFGEMRGTSATGERRRLRIRCSFVTLGERVSEFRVEAGPGFAKRA